MGRLRDVLRNKKLPIRDAGDSCPKKCKEVPTSLESLVAEGDR